MLSPPYANTKASGQTFPLWTLLSFFLCFSCCSRLTRRDESCLGNIFRQPRDVCHNWAPFTTVMCACAQFTVVVFWKGLWHSFIGCSRCPFACKCIYIYKSVYTFIPRKCFCAFSLLLHPGIKLPLKGEKRRHINLQLPYTIFSLFLFFFFSQINLLLSCSF